MKPIVTPLEYTYKKVDSDVWVLNSKDIPLDFNSIIDTQIVHLSPQSIGGNHSHPRIEWFVAIGELELYWLDESNKLQSIHMNPAGQLQLIEIPSYMPHAVKNISLDKSGILYELANDIMKDVTSVKVV